MDFNMVGPGNRIGPQLYRMLCGMLDCRSRFPCRNGPHRRGAWKIHRNGSCAILAGDLWIPADAPDEQSDSGRNIIPHFRHCDRNIFRDGLCLFLDLSGESVRDRDSSLAKIPERIRKVLRSNRDHRILCPLCIRLRPSHHWIKIYPLYLARKMWGHCVPTVACGYYNTHEIDSKVLKNNLV